MDQSLISPEGQMVIYKVQVEIVQSQDMISLHGDINTCDLNGSITLYIYTTDSKVGVPPHNCQV